MSLAVRSYHERMVANTTEIEKRLWDAADQLRANSKLRSSEYSVPVLGLIFLRYADFRFAQAENILAGQATRRRTIDKTDYQAQGVMYLRPETRWNHLMSLPEGENIGRAGFVMANSASDARHSELEIRRQLIEDRAVDVMVAVGGNFFYTVTLPCTLWFLDKGKRDTERENTVLFIDARSIYRQIDRAHRDFTDEQIEFLSNVVRLYRGELPETDKGSTDLMGEHFPDGVYADVPGLCKVATIDEIAAQGYSLNPGRYVGVAAREGMDDFDFKQRMEELHETLELLNAEAHELEERIADNMRQLLNGD